MTIADILDIIGWLLVDAGFLIVLFALADRNGEIEITE